MLTEEQLKTQAKDSPESLFEDVRKSSDPNYLTFAAEYVGHVDKGHKEEALKVLEELLLKFDASSNPYHFLVREGVINGLIALVWGLEETPENEEFIEHLQKLVAWYTYLANEKSVAVRKVAITAMSFI